MKPKTIAVQPPHGWAESGQHKVKSHFNGYFTKTNNKGGNRIKHARNDDRTAEEMYEATRQKTVKVDISKVEKEVIPSSKTNIFITALLFHG